MQIRYPEGQIINGPIGSIRKVLSWKIKLYVKFVVCIYFFLNSHQCNIFDSGDQSTLEKILTVTNQSKRETQSYMLSEAFKAYTTILI